MSKTPLELPADQSEQLIVKSQEVSNPEYGKKPEERTIQELLEYGVINLDKVSGPTSHEVVSWVRNILGLENVGHGGTLDPKVTGILPVGLGKATRVLSALLSAGKEYICVMYLHSEESKKKIQKILKVFNNKIYQRPPLKSSVARRLRIREVYYNQLLQIEGSHVLFRVGCEAGMYIRKLCYDIGEALCSGAHMLELRRTRVGHFKEDKTLVTLQNVKDAFTFYQKENDEFYLRNTIYPMERMVSHMPKIYVRDTAVDALCHGADLAAAGVCNIDARIEPNMQVALMSLKKELIGFGIAKKDAMSIYKANKGIMIKIDKVFMERGTYPRWNEKIN
ncbi:MAG: RNA-guided pseudouridylation complex pseudouridine synthase subunit Cbf5 [Candidatus Lokiarchaeota archaeon]|nr:RNA-guided pseudouridylation complex pseudouridine synthase subunit Cbf5 [Candidatus Lokiarchaeota archaeon]MBD3200580.1 RNA-guided pseudouridylation complex pseudouridine synthase subunit Cbf5 [Candidatus Lokiarchaeota archaeon]